MRDVKTNGRRLAGAFASREDQMARAIDALIYEQLGEEFEDDPEQNEIPIGSFEDLVTDEECRENFFMEHKIVPKYVKPYDFKTDRPIATK